MLLLVANSKGGVGKTSLATSFLAELAKNKSVIGVDLDGANKSASKLWSQNRTEDQGKFYYLSGDIYDELLNAKSDYDEVVVDAGGYDNQELRHAMLLADIILVPLKVGANLNIEGFRNIMELAEKAIALRESKPKIYGVVTCAPHLGVNPEMARAIEEIVEDPMAETVKTTIGDRIWYSRALDAGLGLTEYTSPNQRDGRYVDIAQKEFMQLFLEIYNNEQR